jgi:hypothetical protein
MMTGPAVSAIVDSTPAANTKRLPVTVVTSGLVKHADIAMKTAVTYSR